MTHKSNPLQLNQLTDTIRQQNARTANLFRQLSKIISLLSRQPRSGLRQMSFFSFSCPAIPYSAGQQNKKTTRIKNKYNTLQKRACFRRLRAKSTCCLSSFPKKHFHFAPSVVSIKQHIQRLLISLTFFNGLTLNLGFFWSFSVKQYFRCEIPFFARVASNQAWISRHCEVCRCHYGWKNLQGSV